MIELFTFLISFESQLLEHSLHLNKYIDIDKYRYYTRKLSFLFQAIS